MHALGDNHRKLHDVHAHGALRISLIQLKVLESVLSKQVATTLPLLFIVCKTLDEFIHVYSPFPVFWQRTFIVRGEHEIRMKHSAPQPAQFLESGYAASTGSDAPHEHRQYMSVVLAD
jgi:hypothetical protein